MISGRIAVLLGLTFAAGSVLPMATPASASGNGIAGESPSQIIASAKNALQGAQSYNVAGTIHEGSQTIGLNVTASSSGTGSGSVTINGQKVQIIKVGPNVYFRSGAAFWKQQAGASAAGLFANKWVEGPASDASFQQLASFFDTTQLTDQLLNSTSGTSFTKAGHSSIGGTDVLLIKGKDNNGKEQGNIYIAASGSPYIIRLSLTSGDSTGSVTFSRFNAPVHPKVPSSIVQVAGAKPSSPPSSTTTAP